MQSGRGRWLCGLGEAECRWVGSGWGILTQAICCTGWGSTGGMAASLFTLTSAGRFVCMMMHAGGGGGGDPAD